MKTLIVYYSFTKNNELLAKDLQRKLSCDILQIEEVHKRTGFTIFFDLIFNRKPKIKSFNISFGAYDHVVFVAPIWAGKIASPLKTCLLHVNGSIFAYSFITVCAGREGQKEKIFEELTTLLRHDPEVVTELWINDLLPKEQKDTIRFTSGYKLKENDLETFSKKIDKFIDAIDTLVLDHW